MRRLGVIGLTLVLIVGSAGCRPRPTPGPASGIPASTPEARPTIPSSTSMPTPAPTLPGRGYPVPGRGHPVPTDVERISPQNMDRLAPIWRDESLIIRDIQPGADTHVALTPDGLAWLSAKDRDLIRFVPLPTGTEFPQVLAVRPDRQAAVVGTRDGVLWLVDLNTGEIRAEARITAEIRALAFVDAEAQRVAVLADSLQIWEVGGPISEPIHGFPRKDYKGFLTSDGRLAVSVDTKGQGTVWEVVAGRAVVTFTLPFTSPKAIALHPEGRYVVAGAGDRVLVLHLDPERGQFRTVQELKYRNVEWVGATASHLAIMARPGGEEDTQVVVIPWEQERPILHLHGDRRFDRIRLDAERERLFLIGYNQMKVYSLRNGEEVQSYFDLPTFRAVPIWKRHLLVLAGPSVYPDIAVLDLRTTIARFTELRDPIRSLWADPEGRWIAAAFKDGSLSFMDLELVNLGYVETRNVEWIGRDAQGRGLIGIGRNEVLLGAVGQKSPLWRRALPVSPKSQLIGSVSPQWIAVATRFEGDTIWLLDHEGNIRHTIRKPEFTGAIEDLEWSSDVLVVYLSSKGSQGSAYVFRVPGGQLLARFDVEDLLVARSHWWPDRNLALIEMMTKGLDVVQLGPPLTRFTLTLDDRKDMRITRIWRVPDTGRFLASVQQVRTVRHHEWKIAYWFYRGGWLRAYDVDARRLIWEKPLFYSPVWMEVDPEGKWVILGGAEGVLEVWGVR